MILDVYLINFYRIIKLNKPVYLYDVLYNAEKALKSINLNFTKLLKRKGE